MKRITPFLWFATEAEEAATLYVSIFPNSAITSVVRYGDAGPGPKGTAMTVSFTLDGVHPHDVGQFIDAQGIAIRVGHHCAQPVHRHFGVYASNRASSGIYNSVEDAQALVEALKKVRPIFEVE